MSDVSVALDSLKISDNDDLPEYEESEIGPDDSASKIGKTDAKSVISVASDTSVTSSTQKQLKDELYKRALKKIQALEAKIEELTEKLASYSGSPLKRKKKDVEFNMTVWNTRITETGYFKANGGKSVFNTNAARLSYISSLMDFYNTELSSSTTFDELFEQINGKYPAFQSLLDAFLFLVISNVAAFSSRAIRRSPRNTSRLPRRCRRRLCRWRRCNFLFHRL